MNAHDSHHSTPPVAYRGLWLALLILMLIGGFHAYYYLPFIADDALISLRYAERLLNGSGLTWTAGEAVEGYSNLAWTLGVALLGTLGIDLIEATRVLGMISLGLALWGLSQITQLRQHPAPNSRVLPFFIGGLVYITSPPVGVWSIGGLEATLFAGALIGYFIGGSHLL